MARKINPTSFRIGITMPWANRWFFKKSIKFFLEEDCAIRKIIKERISQAGIASIEIERTSEAIRVFIKASRPGLIIGRGGKGIDDLKNAIIAKVKSLRKSSNITKNFTLNLNVEELRRFDVSAMVISSQIASDIERRMPYRTVLKRHLDALKQVKEVKGGKIRLSGRLNGAEISRRDWLSFGRMPLQTLRSNIDYGEATSFNTYGTVGVKVWIYKGEIFEEK